MLVRNIWKYQHLMSFLTYPLMASEQIINIQYIVASIQKDIYCLSLAIDAYKDEFMYQKRRQISPNS